MATSKLLKPTNVTISIPEFTDQPDQRVNSNGLDKEADAINAISDHIGTLPNPTSINSVSELKTHILAIHNSLANNGIQTSHIDIASGYADGYFVPSSRYVGTYKRSTANQGVIEYSSPNKGDTVTVGLYSASVSPTLNIYSSYSNIVGYDSVPVVQVKYGNVHSLEFKARNGNWQCGIAIANVNGYGNLIFAFNFGGGNTATLTAIMGTLGTAITSVTYSSGKITFTSNTYTFSTLTVILCG